MTVQPKARKLTASDIRRLTEAARKSERKREIAARNFAKTCAGYHPLAR